MTALVYGGWVSAITYAIIAVGVILITRGKLSYGRSDSLAARPPQVESMPG
jgi:hypothetical protein